MPDADDEPFLAVALAGHADYLVTGNLADYPVEMRRGCAVVSPVIIEGARIAQISAQGKGLEIDLEPCGTSHLPLLVVETQKLFETQFERGGDVKEVGGAAANAFIVSSPDSLRPPISVCVIERGVDKKDCRVEVLLDFTESARAVGDRDAFGPDEQANGVPNFKPMLQSEGHGLAMPFHVSYRPFSPLRFGQVQAYDEARVGVGSHGSMPTLGRFIQPEDVLRAQHAITEPCFDPPLEIRHQNFLPLFARENAQVRNHLAVAGDGDFTPGMFPQDLVPLFAYFADSNTLHVGQYVRQNECWQLLKLIPGEAS